jgi:redox-sensing transcriptional repressor
MAEGKKIPASTVNRLSLYLRVFGQVEISGTQTVSSRELAEHSGINSAQVRKDLAYFGQFGRRGVGYSVPDLKARIRSILGLDKEWRVAIIGVGHLGTALLMYGGFGSLRFKVVAAFDNDPDKIDWELEGTRIYPLSEMAKVAQAEKIDIAILTVPSAAVQSVADQVVAAEIPSILNFAPARLQVPQTVLLRNVDLASELEALSYRLQKH